MTDRAQTRDITVDGFAAARRDQKMEKRTLQRIVRKNHLTPEEVAKDQEVRRKVQEEFPPAPRVVEPISESIAESLKQAIRQSGRSAYQISKDSGIALIVIARFLSGERDIRMATADKLARALKHATHSDVARNGYEKRR